MATRKTDVVRRSLFGSADVDERDVDVREQRAAAVRPRTRKKVPRTVEAEAINAGVTRASRRLVERTAITVPSELLLRVKDAVAVLNGWPHQIYTMARLSRRRSRLNSSGSSLSTMAAARSARIGYCPG